MTLNGEFGFGEQTLSYLKFAGPRAAVPRILNELVEVFGAVPISSMRLIYYPDSGGALDIPSAELLIFRQSGPGRRFMDNIF